MAYNLTPIAISTIDPTKPADNEQASQASLILRQTRTIYNGLLSVICNDDGSLKAVSNLAANAVVTASITDGAVTAAKIAANTITASQLAANAVTTTVLASDASIDANRAVNTNHIKDGAIVARHFASGAIGSVAVGTDGVDTINIKAGAVTNPKLATDAVQTVNIKDAQVTAAKLNTSGKVAMYLDNATTVELLEIDTSGSMLVPSKVGGKLQFATSGLQDYFANTTVIQEVGAYGGTPVLSANAGTTGYGHGVNAGPAYISAWEQRPYFRSVGNGNNADSTFVAVIAPSTPHFSIVVDGTTHKTSLVCNLVGTYSLDLLAVASTYTAVLAGHIARIVRQRSGVSDVELFKTTPAFMSTNTQVATHGFGVATLNQNDVLVIQHLIGSNVDQGSGSPGAEFFYGTSSGFGSVALVELRITKKP